MSHEWLQGNIHNLGNTKVGNERITIPALLDIAWAAGIFEGEGHSRYNGRTSEASISQKDRWILDKLKSLFGGRVYGPYKKKGRAKYRIYAWVCLGPRARGFLMTIYSFLSPRRKIQAFNTLNW